MQSELTPRQLHKKGFDIRRHKSKRALPIAKKALRLATSNSVIEFTSFLTLNSSLAVGGAPFIEYLEPPPTEAAPGKQTLLKIRGNVIMERNLLSNLLDRWRFDIILDRTPSGIILNIDQAYDPAIPGKPVTTIPINYKQIKRYKLLYSRKGVFGDGVSIASVHNLNIPIKLVAEANAVIPNQASIMKNAIYLVFWTDALANAPKITYDVDLVSRTS